MTRKQLIMDSALQLFAEKGIEATSVQQITDHCGISKGAFYLSFKSKDELIYAIIEHFMNNIIREVDRAVKEGSTPSEKLHIYFVHTFKVMSQYTGFAEILMKEKVSAINEALIERIQYYVDLAKKSLEKLLFEVFGDQIEGKQYDLVLVVNGMVQAYLQNFFESCKPFDVIKLADSLVEKTTLLATKSEIVFLKDSSQLYSRMKVYSTEHIIEELDQLQQQTNDNLEQESIQLLKEELTMENPRPAIVIGLVSNLEKNENFNWVTLYLKNHFI
ncbi:TetR/AcrR family transcriptional regulator [Solibacillus sp. FSL W8-0474]|uniref:TetR/AcrR family transcriptional regulator n=1 Tax=Solibacillus sp. FSL W8-0474 TaxID=2975336 RepID=UPI0030F88C2B